MHEYEQVENLDAPSQGDVIEWIGEHRSAPWHTFGVIVTADCDLERDKHRGMISYVPAFLVEDFIWSYWRRDKLNPKLSEFLHKSSERITNWRMNQASGSGAMSTEAIYAWLVRLGAEDVLDELGVTNKGERNDLLNVVGPTAALVEIMNRDEPDLQLLSRVYTQVNPRAAADPSLLVKEIQAAWSKLPGDVFHLPSMPAENGSAEDGLFLMLRHIRQIDADEVTARPDEVRSGKAKVKRIARVTAPYRYAMTQNLAKVFSDIGLPSEHEERCGNAAKRFFEARKIA